MVSREDKTQGDEPPFSFEDGWLYIWRTWVQVPRLRTRIMKLS